MYEHVGRLPVKLWDVTLSRPGEVFGKKIKYESIPAFDEMGAIAIVQEKFETANGKVPSSARWLVEKR